MSPNSSQPDQTLWAAMINLPERDLLARTLPRTYTDAGEPPLSASSLDREMETDIVVIGGGIMGASAALHLAAGGASVCLVEAETIGSGGSGRSFGQVVPYLRTEPDVALANLGKEAGTRLINVAARSPDLVFDLIAHYGIDCDAVRNGLLFAAHAPAGEASLRSRRDWWAARGVDLPLLDREEAATAIGGGFYPCVLVEPRGGTLNPLAYARGLARSCASLGGLVFEQSPVSGIVQSGNGFFVTAGRGAIRCRTVVVTAGLGLRRLLPAYRRTLLPVRVHEAATEPLSVEQIEGILPSATALTETRKLPSGIRRTSGGQIVVTLSGPAAGERGADPDAAARRLTEVFPQLSSAPVFERWSGWVDLTRDQYPRIEEPQPGFLVGFGLSGRGLGLGTTLGKDLACRALGAPWANIPFPGRGQTSARKWWPGSSFAASLAMAAIRMSEEHRF
ncbi:FAD-dependent oxidoreductase [Agrobacterium vitis]|uniref:FAD-dependent oxidoreductase n=2 Tax=Agrobacterium vitis TaxID=373 RepID=A0A7K1RGM7_AGRVI|nr:FAD-dependent oxidoreductase [Agrobacterium vitis]MUO79808.1 FAD-dependent oxidoreductase [Agrobacterium vitis]MUO93703.1 FAD-dependent oxidoreductase [Agrobacterium vitis]MUP04046.1 FAD-dependent oxidoreductase [Agrobacterium vitis]MVA57145.1 FAD-dependent oxidoreductase [Agrobacterium vitis]